MSRVISNQPPTLYEALKAEGFVLPDECCEVRMIMPVDGVYQLHYEVNLRAEDLIKIGKALQRIAMIAGARDDERTLYGEGR